MGLIKKQYKSGDEMPVFPIIDITWDETPEGVKFKVDFPLVDGAKEILKEVKDVQDN